MYRCTNIHKCIYVLYVCVYVAKEIKLWDSYRRKMFGVSFPYREHLQTIAWLDHSLNFISEHFVYLELTTLLRIYQTYLQALDNLLLNHSFTNMSSNFEIFLGSPLRTNQTLFQLLCHLLPGIKKNIFPRDKER